MVFDVLVYEDEPGLGGGLLGGPLIFVLGIKDGLLFIVFDLEGCAI